jgi:hypothetical protein
MGNSVKVTRDKLFAVSSLSGVNTLNSLVFFYGIHVRKGEVLVFYSVIEHTINMEV